MLPRRVGQRPLQVGGVIAISSAIKEVPVTTVAVIVSRQAVRLPRLPVDVGVLPRVIFAGQLNISLKIALNFRK